MEGFIFGGNTPWTYDQLQRKRAVAESLLAGAGAAPRNVGEGLNAIGKALAYRGLEKRASKEEARLRSEFDAKWGGAFGGMPGMGGAAGSAGGGGSPSGTWTPAPPAPKPTESFMGKGDVADGGLSYGLPAADAGVASGGLDYGANVMTPQEMLIAGAKARGLDPIDVATAISYETGGKFDPTIKGPTTQWGTHEGLIQFGDPQGQEHGAVFDQGADAAWRSQLDPTNGAVWSYLDSVGVKPGMGLDQIYSGINAGGVDRMGASDANNGGAPGTVADKVAGMGDHRVKAAEFLGGTWTPTEGGGAGGGGVPQMDMASLAALAGDPMASPQQKAIVEALIAQQLQGMDPLRQLEMEKAQLELAQMKDPGQAQPEELTDRMALLAAAGVDPASAEGKNYLLTGELPEAIEPPPEPDAPTTKQVKLADGSEVMVQWNPETQVWDASPIPLGGTTGTGLPPPKPFTEGQSKDIAYATRAKGALEVLDPIAGALTDRGDVAAGWLPMGLGGGLQAPEYQVAKTAGDEFLQAILRKDTGAAITKDEQSLYGETYLPKPGDSAERLAYKAEARKRAVAAIEAGMSAAQIVAQEKALSGGAPPPAASAPPAAADADGWKTINGVKIRVKQ